MHTHIKAGHNNLMIIEVADINIPECTLPPKVYFLDTLKFTDGLDIPKTTIIYSLSLLPYCN